MTRGSRKHVLDWTSRPNFPTEFRELISSSKLTLSHPSVWQPRGHSEPAEARLEDCGARFVPGADCWEKLSNWWLAHRRGANTPNWDLVVACDIECKPGLILVEAKAHERELDWDGKHQLQGRSIKSSENHARIGQAIAEASGELGKIIPGVNISRDSHYQLANRLAYSWKLASMGIPIILVYLGFTGDRGIEDVGPSLRDHAHWESIIHSYTAGVLPDGFIGQRLHVGNSHMRMIVRSKPVFEQSQKQKPDELSIANRFKRS